VNKTAEKRLKIVTKLYVDRTYRGFASQIFTKFVQPLYNKTV